MATQHPLPSGGKITFYTSEVKSALGQKQERFVRTAVQMIEDRVKSLMTNSPRGGKVYRVGKTATKADRAAGRRFRSHKASAPGEPPAVNTGRLRNSVTSLVIPRISGGYEGRVGSNVKYARPLETGNPPHLKPRPAWLPALQWVWPKVVAMFKGK